MIVQQLVYRGFRLAGIMKRAQGGPSPSEYEDGFNELNSMLDGFLSEKLLVFGQIGKSVPIVPNKQTYTMGPLGADITTPGPQVNIDHAEYVFTNLNPPVQQQFRILTDQEWDALSPKTYQSTIPYYLWLDRSTVPNATLYVWPVPLTNSQVGSMTIWLWGQVQQFATINDDVILRPAYQRMIEYNLAIGLANLFPDRATISPFVAAEAVRTKAFVKSNNLQPILMVAEAGGRGLGENGRYNMFSNQYMPSQP